MGNAFEKMVATDNKTGEDLVVGYHETLLWYNTEWTSPNENGTFVVQFEDGTVESLQWYNRHDDTLNIFQELLRYVAFTNVMLNDEPMELEDLPKLARFPYFWYVYDYREVCYYIEDLQAIRVYTASYPKYWLACEAEGPVGSDEEEHEVGRYKLSGNGYIKVEE